MDGGGMKSIRVDEFKAQALPYVGALWSTALWLTLRRSDAENLAAKTMLLAYDSWHDIADHSSSKARLLRIMFTEFFDSVPGAYRPEQYVHEHCGPDEPAAICDTGTAKTSIDSSEVELLADIPDMYVRAAIARLKPVPRLIMVLHFGERFSYDDIAYITGLPKASVKSTLNKARRLIPSYLVRNGGRIDDAAEGCDGCPDQDTSADRIHGLDIEGLPRLYGRVFSEEPASERWEDEGETSHE